jgi:hypothetical protein
MARALAALWPLLPAAPVAYAVASWLPAAWPLRAAAGLVAYLGVLFLGGALAPAELRRAWAGARQT